MPHSIFLCHSHDCLLSVVSGRFVRGTVLVGRKHALDCGAEEKFRRRYFFHNNHTERNTVNDYGDPESNQKRWLARFVSQKYLGNQGTGPSANQA